MLQDYPDTFIALQIHVGDAHMTTWGAQRAGAYEVMITPTAWFDGVRQAVGASGDIDDQYAWYLDECNARRAVETDVVIWLSAAQVAGAEYEVTATVYMEPNGTARTLRVHLAQVLDKWPTNPSYSRQCFKQAAASEDIALSPGESHTIIRSFTFDGDSWANQADIGIVAWAQAPSDDPLGEVQQAELMRWPFSPARDAGDLDCNGILNMFDIDPFVLALTSAASGFEMYSATWPDCDPTLADANGDGFVNGLDVDAFVALLTAE